MRWDDWSETFVKRDWSVRLWSQQKVKKVAHCAVELDRYPRWSRALTFVVLPWQIGFSTVLKDKLLMVDCSCVLYMPKCQTSAVDSQMGSLSLVCCSDAELHLTWVTKNSKATFYAFVYPIHRAGDSVFEQYNFFHLLIEAVLQFLLLYSMLFSDLYFIALTPLELATALWPVENCLSFLGRDLE